MRSLQIHTWWQEIIEILWTLHPISAEGNNLQKHTRVPQQDADVDTVRIWAISMTTFLMVHLYSHTHLTPTWSIASALLSFAFPSRLPWHEYWPSATLPQVPEAAQLFSICFSLLFRLGKLYHFTVTSILQWSPSAGLFVWDNMFFSPLLPLGSSLGLLFLC